MELDIPLIPKCSLVFSCLILVACGSGGGSDDTELPLTANGAANIILIKAQKSQAQLGLQAYLETAPSSLVDCVKPGALSCDFASLPLIGQESLHPSAEDLLKRLVVSDDWMGQRFARVLKHLPSDTYQMARSIRGIVISDEIMPSYYDPTTASIYLSAESLWLSAAEKNAMNSLQDARAEAMTQLQFRFLWRYVLAGQDIYQGGRAIDQVVQMTAAVWFHELAHANDLIPQSLIAELDPSSAPESLEHQALMTGLYQQAPLTTAELTELAQSYYGLQAAPSSHQVVSTQQVANWFAADVGNGFYNFVDPHEDLAMLVEEALMYYSFGAERDIALVENLNSAYCDDLAVVWGSRSRLAEENIQARANWVLQAMDLQAMDLQSRPQRAAPGLEVMPLAQGESWCTNGLVPSARRSLRFKGGQYEMNPAQVYY